WHSRSLGKTGKPSPTASTATSGRTYPPKVRLPGRIRPPLTEPPHLVSLIDRRLSDTETLQGDLLPGT
ncbi:MAG TPA: hypothetical protein VJP78_08695, partial [Thermoleophilia bacterium]|nr:hypothetical protein [Thermoleophilia bacterium]